MYLLIASLILISIVEVYLSSNYALSFALNGIVGLILIIEVGCAIYLGKQAIKRKQKNFTFLVILSIGIFFVAHYLGSMNSRELSRISRIEGDKIINTIEVYKKDVGKLPTTLNDLIPKYLNNIPSPGFKNSEYYYILDKERNDYVVRYDAPGWMQCDRSLKRQWKCTD